MKSLAIAPKTTPLQAGVIASGTAPIDEQMKTSPMKTANINRYATGICLAALFMTSASHAEIYKWVDANGQTHYSERKEDAVKGNAVEVKVRTGQESSTEKTSPTEYWKEKDRQFKQRLVEKSNQKASLPPEDTGPKALWDGKNDTSNASRCNLAKDVLSGAVRHTNGKPTDKNDRDIAESDIRLFCR